MESLRETFFEDPFYVYVFLALLGLVVVGVWYSRRRTGLLLWLALLGAIGAGVYVLERAVVTDREQIRAALDEMAAAAARQDMDAIARHVDEKFRVFDSYVGRGLGKAATLLAARGALAMWSIREVRFVGDPEDDLQIDGRSHAEGTVRTTLLYGKGKLPRRYYRAWRLEWVRRADGWKLRRAELSDDVMP